MCVCFCRVVSHRIVIYVTAPLGSYLLADTVRERARVQRACVHTACRLPGFSARGIAHIKFISFCFTLACAFACKFDWILLILGIAFRR